MSPDQCSERLERGRGPVGAGLLLCLLGFAVSSCGVSALQTRMLETHATADALVLKKEPTLPSRPLVMRHAVPYVSVDRVPRSKNAGQHEAVLVRAVRLPFEICLEEGLAQLSEPPSVAFAADLIGKRSVPVTLDHRLGSFADFLDLLADASGYGWEIRAGALYWMEDVTRTFEVRRVPATLSYSVTSGVSDQQQVIQQSGGGGGSGQIRAAPRGNASISLSSAGVFWEDLNRTLTQLLGDEGNLVIDRATGTVVLRGNAGRVRLAGRYIAALNEWLGRQVLLEVQLVTVSFSDERSAGVDWQLVQSATEGGVALNAASSLAGIATRALGIEPPTAGFTIAAAPDEVDSLAGSGLILRALSAQGKTSVVNSPRLVVLNGQAAQIQVLSDRGILSGVGVNTVGTVAGVTEVELQTGTVSTGIAVTMLPKIVGDEVFLHANIMLSDLVEVNTAGSGGDSGQVVQLPTVERSQFFQSARLKTGQTLALGGLLQDRAGEESQSITRFKWLGSRTDTTRMAETVLLITPWLLDRPGANEDTLL